MIIYPGHGIMTNLEHEIENIYISNNKILYLTKLLKYTKII